MGQLGVLLQIALRNIFASFINIIIGGIILVGTLLVIVGSSLFDSVDSAMARSITGSLAGHIQVYNAESKEEVAIFGQMGGSDPDLDPFADFAKVKQVISGLENVQAVVPMGFGSAMMSSGNTIDLTLAELREAIRKRQQGGANPALDAKIQSIKEHVRQMVLVLQKDLLKATELVDKSSLEPEVLAAVARAGTEEFWAGFDADPFEALEFLENRIAPQAPDGDLLYVRYMGTDLDSYQKAFDRMTIVDGQMVPKGQRGFLFAKFAYEEMMKLKVARRLDKLFEAIGEGGKSIATDPQLQRWVQENRTQVKEILLQLDGQETKTMIERLQKKLGVQTPELAGLLSQFFDVNDENLPDRHAFFYEQMAPMMQLYRVRVGDDLTISSFTRSGSVQSVSVKVYGTFGFKGLEKSPLAGATHIMDLMTFRDLYGYLTADREQEIRDLQKASGAKSIARESAEADLFGSAAPAQGEQAMQGQIDVEQELSTSEAKRRHTDVSTMVYTQQEIDSGVVLSSAVVLKDPRRLTESMAAIDAAAKAQGLNVKLADWQVASGILGQFVLVLKLALYFAVFIIFVVGLVIINNSMMMATMQRAREIGTMRAIGAQSGFVLLMVLLETILLGLVFGTAGALLGSGFMRWLGTHGIAAPNEEMYFLFSGPRLYPTFGLEHLVTAFVIILVVSALSTLYPAFLATRVSPLRAMQTEE
jgi:ABC-type lipoprotein release transport system permease subunit